MSLRKPTKKKQDELTAVEIEKWNDVFEDLSEDKKQVAERLIEQVAFMKITLDILKVNIQLDGATYLFKQGKQEMIIENPAQKSYVAMMNRYTAACNSLFNLLPKEGPKNNDDGFDAFVNKR